ncbi:MAG TPA: hypothetical protein VGJ33_04920 [Candidatus Angelobacter sp.]|jgi:hypothetical protein
MNSATQPSKIRSLDSNGTNRLTKNTNFFSRFWNRLTEGLGTGSRKPENYSSMSQSELEQRAAEDMAIAKAMGF